MYLSRLNASSYTSAVLAGTRAHDCGHAGARRHACSMPNCLKGAAVLAVLLLARLQGAHARPMPGGMEVFGNRQLLDLHGVPDAPAVPPAPKRCKSLEQVWSKHKADKCLTVGKDLLIAGAVAIVAGLLMHVGAPCFNRRATPAPEPSAHRADEATEERASNPDDDNCGETVKFAGNSLAALGGLVFMGGVIACSIAAAANAKMHGEGEPYACMFGYG